MPGGSATAYRRCSAAEADGAPYVRPLEYLVATGRVPGRLGDRHRTGGRWKRSFFYEFVRASIARPSSHLPAKARRFGGRGNAHARRKPKRASRLARVARKWEPVSGKRHAQHEDTAPPELVEGAEGSRAKRAFGRERKEIGRGDGETRG
jgi:hypothetical protein